MATKSTFTYWPGQGQRRLVSPEAVRRRPWKPGESVRIVSGPEVTSGDTFARVWLEDCHQPGLVFRLDVDRDGRLVGFSVRPLVFVEERTDEGQVVSLGEVDDNAVLPDSRCLTAKLIQRDVHLGRLHAAATAAVRRLSLVVPLDAESGVARTGLPRRGRRSNLTDRDLAAFVAEYRRLLDQGQRANVNAQLAARHHLSLDGVSYRIRQARSRRRGLLTGTTRGRPGGVLTPKATALLQLDQED